jgi:hypothetical protein
MSIGMMNCEQRRQDEDPAQPLAVAQAGNQLGIQSGNNCWQASSLLAFRLSPIWTELVTNYQTEHAGDAELNGAKLGNTILLSLMVDAYARQVHYIPTVPGQCQVTDHQQVYLTAMDLLRSWGVDMPHTESEYGAYVETWRARVGPKDSPITKMRLLRDAVQYMLTVDETQLPRNWQLFARKEFPADGESLIRVLRNRMTDYAKCNGLAEDLEREAVWFQDLNQRIMEQLGEYRIVEPASSSHTKRRRIQHGFTKEATSRGRPTMHLVFLGDSIKNALEDMAEDLQWEVEHIEAIDQLLNRHDSAPNAMQASSVRLAVERMVAQIGNVSDAGSPYLEQFQHELKILAQDMGTGAETNSAWRTQGRITDPELEKRWQDVGRAWTSLPASLPDKGPFATALAANLYREQSGEDNLADEIEKAVAAYFSALLLTSCSPTWVGTMGEAWDNLQTKTMLSLLPHVRLVYTSRYAQNSSNGMQRVWAWDANAEVPGYDLGISEGIESERKKFPPELQRTVYVHESDPRMRRYAQPPPAQLPAFTHVRLGMITCEIDPEPSYRRFLHSPGAAAEGLPYGHAVSITFPASAAQPWLRADWLSWLSTVASMGADGPGAESNFAENIQGSQPDAKAVVVTWKTGVFGPRSRGLPGAADALPEQEKCFILDPNERTPLNVAEARSDSDWYYTWLLQLFDDDYTIPWGAKYGAPDSAQADARENLPGKPFWMLRTVTHTWIECSASSDA